MLTCILLFVHYSYVKWRFPFITLKIINELLNIAYEHLTLVIFSAHNQPIHFRLRVVDLVLNVFAKIVFFSFREGGEEEGTEESKLTELFLTLSSYNHLLSLFCDLWWLTHTELFP